MTTSGAYPFVREALDYASKFRDQIFVIKIDDSIVNKDQADLLTSLVRDLKLLYSLGIKLEVIVSSLPIATYLETCSGLKIVELQGMKKTTEDFAAAEYAIKERANKLIFLTRYDGLFQSSGALIRQITSTQVSEIVREEQKNSKKSLSGGMLSKVKAAIIACREGVPRVHLVNGTREGELIGELFSSEGVGTMICSDLNLYQSIRPATEDDIEPIYEMLLLQESLYLTRAVIVQSLPRLHVYCLDDKVIGCAWLGPAKEFEALKITHLMTTGSDNNLSKKMLTYLIEETQKQGKASVILTQKNQHLLFLDPCLAELGFVAQKTGSDRVWIKSIS